MSDVIMSIVTVINVTISIGETCIALFKITIHDQILFLAITSYIIGGGDFRADRNRVTTTNDDTIACPLVAVCTRSYEGGALSVIDVSVAADGDMLTSREDYSYRVTLLYVRECVKVDAIAKKHIIHYNGVNLITSAW